MKVPLLDLGASHQGIAAGILADWKASLKASSFIHGPHGRAFEAEAGKALGVRYCLGCNSGTDALLILLRAWGIGAGDEVLVPSFSFFATAEAVSLAGAKPVFCDIDAQTFLLDSDDALKRANARTRAVLGVHLFGLPWDPAELKREFRRKLKRRVLVLEDAAQAFGASLGQRKVGGLGDGSGFSFYPTKNLAAAGDAGMLATDDKRIAEKARRLREHGMPRRYVHTEIGYNSRLDELQAAVVRRKLPLLAGWNALRSGIAARYSRLLQATPLVLPTGGPGAVWHQYTVRVPAGRRDALMRHLNAAGVGTGVFYPIPIHRQKPYASNLRLPRAEQAAREVLSLPMHPHLKPAQQAFVAAQIARFYARQR